MTALLLAASLFAADPPGALADADRKQLDSGLKELNAQIDRLRSDDVAGCADAEVFAKGVAWALRYDTQFDAASCTRLAASRTATAGPAKPTFSRRSMRFVGITRSTATTSSFAACRWAPRGRGTSA
jgi:hypothetical protein